MKAVIIDNYDSFTYNLAHAVKALGAETEIVRNDRFKLGYIGKYDKYGAQNEAYMSRSAEKWVRALCFNELGVCG